MKKVAVIFILIASFVVAKVFKFEKVDLPSFQKFESASFSGKTLKIKTRPMLSGESARCYYKSYTARFVVFHVLICENDEVKI